MKSNYKEFDFDKSLQRIDEILTENLDISESKTVPRVEDLPYNQGKNVDCTAIFIDLRGSSDFVKELNKQFKSLGRIYKSYISEIVAIMNSFKTCREINIVGDCVSAVFAKGKEEDNIVLDVLQAASISNAMMQVLNKKYQKKWNDMDSMKEIKAGIGIAKGKTLVMKAGLNKSGINDIVYMGDVVNTASKLCDAALKKSKRPICVTTEIYKASNIEANKDTGQTFKDFLHEESGIDKQKIFYSGNFSRVHIREWVEEN